MQGLHLYAIYTREHYIHTGAHLPDWNTLSEADRRFWQIFALRVHAHYIPQLHTTVVTKLP